jgi:hypothetical protein
MPNFLIAEALVADGPLYVLWTRDESCVSVAPWGSRDRRDMQALGRSLAEMAAPYGDPQEQADVILAGARRHAAGRRLGLVDLAETQQDAIARAIHAGTGGTVGQVGGTDRSPAIEAEVLALVGRRMADAP